VSFLLSGIFHMWECVNECVFLAHILWEFHFESWYSLS
jgi:hypothetical protein